MSPRESKASWPHEDAALFREALRFTVAQTGFSARLIEKDYFCTVVLEHLSRVAKELVFKGGTCLSKVHAGFYRLSEDLDFSVPMAFESKRAERSRAAKPLKSALAGIDAAAVRVTQSLEGAASSTQYAAVVSYTSVLEEREGTIKVEIGLREPLLADTVTGDARTLLLDPLSGDALLAALPLRCLSRSEAMAEKLRAALSRREPAIRDFYDIDHAVRRVSFEPEAAGVLALVRRKLSIPGNSPVDVSNARLELLRQQLDAELRPVLRPEDYADFDLERAFEQVAAVARRVAAEPR